MCIDKRYFTYLLLLLPFCVSFIYIHLKYLRKDDGIKMANSNDHNELKAANEDKKEQEEVGFFYIHLFREVSFSSLIF